MPKLSDGTDVDLDSLKSVWERIKEFLWESEVYSPDMLIGMEQHLAVLAEDLFDIVGYPESEDEDEDDDLEEEM